MPVVIVEIAAAQPPSAPGIAELTRVLLDACSAAVRNGDCEAATDEEPPKAVAIAIVRWDGPPERRARIQVGVRRGAEADWQSRTLEFHRTDLRVERWRSVGLTIATLAGALIPTPGADRTDELRDDKGGAPPTSNAGVPATRTVTGDTQPDAKNAGTAAPAPVPAPSVSTQRTPSKTSAVSEPTPVPEDDHAWRADEGERSARAPPRGWLSAGATLGPGLLEGGPRFGGWLDAAWQPLPPAFARASFSLMERVADDRGVSVQWNTVSLGAGLVIGRGAFSVQPRVAGGLEWLRAFVTAPDSGRTDSSSRADVGIRLGTDAVFRVGSLGFLAGIDAWRNRVATTVAVGRQKGVTDPQTGWAATLGVRYHFEGTAPRPR